MTVAGATHTLRPEMVKIEKVTKTISGRNYTPSVIEPSFGIGRILYCVFEHTFYTRAETDQKPADEKGKKKGGDDDKKKRTVFKFSPTVAPIKATVFPLLQRDELNGVANAIVLDLRRAGLSSIIDTTGAAASSFICFTSDCAALAARRPVQHHRHDRCGAAPDAVHVSQTVVMHLRRAGLSSIVDTTGAASASASGAVSRAVVLPQRLSSSSTTRPVRRLRLTLCVFHKRLCLTRGALA